MVDSPPKPSRKKRLVLWALAPLLIALGLEAAARLAVDAVPPFEPLRIVSDPDLLWRLKPRPDDPKEATNALGLRDAPYRAEAQVRLLLLGDSIAYGEDVAPATACFPYLLERELERVRKRTHEVINSACVGWGTAQQTRFLELRGLGLKPRAVILQFGLDDVADPYRGPDPPQSFRGLDTRHGAKGAHGFLLRRSEAYAWVARRRARPRDSDEAAVRGLTRSPLTPADEAAWTACERELDRLATVCKRNGLPLLVIVTPYRFQLEDPAGTRAPQARLQAWADRAGVPLIDLLPRLAQVRKLMLRELFGDTHHLSETGHRVVGAALGKPIAAWLETLDG